MQRLLAEILQCFIHYNIHYFMPYFILFLQFLLILTSIPLLLLLPPQWHNYIATTTIVFVLPSVLLSLPLLL